MTVFFAHLEYGGLHVENGLNLLFLYQKVKVAEFLIVFLKRTCICVPPAHTTSASGGGLRCGSA